MKVTREQLSLYVGVLFGIVMLLGALTMFNSILLFHFGEPYTELLRFVFSEEVFGSALGAGIGAGVAIWSLRKSSKATLKASFHVADLNHTSAKLTATYQLLSRLGQLREEMHVAFREHEPVWDMAGDVKHRLQKLGENERALGFPTLNLPNLPPLMKEEAPNADLEWPPEITMVLDQIHLLRGSLYSHADWAHDFGMDRPAAEAFVQEARRLNQLMTEFPKVLFTARSRLNDQRRELREHSEKLSRQLRIDDFPD